MNFFKDFAQGDSGNRYTELIKENGKIEDRLKLLQTGALSRDYNNITRFNNSPISTCSLIPDKERNISINSHSDLSKSITDLRKESKCLLAQSHASINGDTTCGGATIFDLCSKDRQRVGKLIGQLAVSLEKIHNLEIIVAEQTDQDDTYKTKCNGLMKKVDVLSEKCTRLIDENNNLNEKHVNSLSKLHDKVSKLSAQFNLSTDEINLLRKQNQNLKAENHHFQIKLAAMAEKVISLEKENKEIKSNASCQQTSQTTRPVCDGRKKRQDSETQSILFPANEPKMLHPRVISYTQENCTQSTVRKEDALLQDLFFKF